MYINRQWKADEGKCSWASLVTIRTFPLLPFCKQTQIPRLKSARKLYNFRLSKNGKLNWRLAKGFCSGWPNFTNSDRILQIRWRLRQPHFLADFQRQQKFGGSGYSAATRKSTLRSENAKKWLKSDKATVLQHQFLCATSKGYKNTRKSSSTTGMPACTIDKLTAKLWSSVILVQHKYHNRLV